MFPVCQAAIGCLYLNDKEWAVLLTVYYDICPVGRYTAWDRCLDLNSTGRIAAIKDKP